MRLCLQYDEMMHRWCQSRLVWVAWELLRPEPQLNVEMRQDVIFAVVEMVRTSESGSLCVHQVQTELRRWIRKCRNQNHPTPAKRSITQITSRAREGFGRPPSSANISSVWLQGAVTEKWASPAETVIDLNQRRQRTVARMCSVSASRKKTCPRRGREGESCVGPTGDTTFDECWRTIWSHLQEQRLLFETSFDWAGSLEGRYLN